MIDTFSSAIKSNDLYLIKKLISNGHNLNLQDLEGISPLHLSCKINRTEITKALIDAGANVFSEDKEGNLPLHYAAIYGNKDIISMFLDKGIDLNHKNNMGNTALFFAITFNNTFTKPLKILLELGADTNTVNIVLNTPLHISCQYSQYEHAKLLLKYNSDVNLKNKYKKTPLDLAKVNPSNNEKLIELLQSYTNYQELSDLTNNNKYSQLKKIKI